MCSSIRTGSEKLSFFLSSTLVSSVDFEVYRTTFLVHDFILQEVDSLISRLRFFLVDPFIYYVILLDFISIFREQLERAEPMIHIDKCSIWL